MRTRLSYHIPPLYQPWTEDVLEAEAGKKPKTSSQEKRSLLLVGNVRSGAYREAQRLREKLQSQINHLLSHNLSN